MKHQERQAWCWTVWDRNVPRSKCASLAGQWPAASSWYAPPPTLASHALTVRSLGQRSQSIPRSCKFCSSFWLFGSASHNNRFVACCWSWFHSMPFASHFCSAVCVWWSCKHKSFSEGPEMARRQLCFPQLRAPPLGRSHAKLRLQFLVSPCRWSHRSRWCSHRPCVLWVYTLLRKRCKLRSASTQVSFSWAEHWSWCPDYDE